MRAIRLAKRIELATPMKLASNHFYLWPLFIDCFCACGAPLAVTSAASCAGSSCSLRLMTSYWPKKSHRFVETSLEQLIAALARRIGEVDRYDR